MQRRTTLISALCICWCVVSGQPPQAQSDTAPPKEGVNFIEGLTWTEVKAKASKENKFIFLDMIATWCAPCKEMDQKTYTNPAVIKFLNAHFISVKVQTDQTSKDPENVKQWYNDAKSISEQYYVTSLPSYIFLFPDGAWAYKDGGYKQPNDFITACEKAITAKATYNDPDKDFRRKATAYKKGNKDTSDLTGLLKKAIELQDYELEQLINKDLWNHLKTLPEDRLYTKDYLTFIAATPLHSRSRYFKLFYPDAKKANRIAGQEGFAERIVNNAIMQEIIIPFWKANGFSPSTFFVGMYQGTVTNSETPNWSKLNQSIETSFGKYYADRNTLEAKVHWYIASQNPVSGYMSYFDILDRYGLDTVDKASMLHPGAINENCWFIFSNLSGKKILQRAVKWMEEALKTKEDYQWLDTYANLLHKLGKSRQAIVIERRAIAIARSHPEWVFAKDSAEEMERLVKKMEQGLPTWPLTAPSASQ